MTTPLTPAQCDYVATGLEEQFPHLSFTVTDDGAGRDQHRCERARLTLVCRRDPSAPSVFVVRNTHTLRFEDATTAGIAPRRRLHQWPPRQWRRRPPCYPSGYGSGHAASALPPSNMVVLPLLVTVADLSSGWCVRAGAGSAPARNGGVRRR